MKAVLFCVNPYAFGILKPLHDELEAQGHQVLWYVHEKMRGKFPFDNAAAKTHLIHEVSDFKTDALFVPGNEVPHYLNGVKVQVFHGLAGEKKGHFRIRNYFDLYLTQGPYFTAWFQQAAHKYKNFEVKETGWCKLDSLFQNPTTFIEEKRKLLQQVGKKTLVLYAPTFSPSLTSAILKKDEIFALADREDIFLQIKFHDLMNAEVIESYRQLAESRINVQIIDDRNILKYLIIADIMISDTSSVVYEFILLDKPVITIDSTSKNISWKNITKEESLHQAFIHEREEDPYKNSRRNIIQQYHPYTDGKSSSRMIAAVEDYIHRHGVPAKRKLNFWRRYKMNKMFGSNPEQH